MRRLAGGCAALLILLAPLGEGGRRPLALFVLHLLAVAAAIGAVAAPRPDPRGSAPGGRRRLAALVGAGLALAALSAARAAYPLAGLLGLMDLLAAAALFLAALVFRAGMPDLRLLRTAFIASTTAQAALALARLAAGSAAGSAATFLNPNHLAAWLNAGLLLCLAEAEDRAGARRGRRRWLPWAILALLHGAAAALLASRGAWIGLGVALLAMAAVRWRGWSPAARRAAAAALILVLAAGGALIARRFHTADDPYRYHRARIWAASAALFADAPILGAGPGMFRHVAPRRQFATDGGPFRYERTFAGAHSGWLTILVENGLPGTACLGAAAILAAVTLMRRRPAFGRGAGLALVALLAHALVEDLQASPALVLVPALLAGAGLGASSGRGSERARRGAPPGVPAAAAISPPARLILAAAAASLVWAGVAAPFLADRAAGRARAAGPAGLPAMHLAARLNPLHPEYRHDLAMAVVNSGPLAPERYAEASLWLEEARRLKPIDARFPTLLARLERLAGERLFHDPAALERAAALYGEASALAPFDPRPRLELAHFLLDRDPGQALDAARQALALEPHFVRAGLLEARLLLDLGRRQEAQAAWRRTEESRSLLAGIEVPSGYAAELAKDEPGFRSRLHEDLDRVARRGAGRRPVRRGAGAIGLNR